MEKVKWYKNTEMLVGLSALFISLITAAISLYSAYIDREYARASVWPKLELHNNYSRDTFSYSVTNQGTGPAVIKYAKVNIGSRFIKKWSDIGISHKDIKQSHISNVTMPSEHTIHPISYKVDNVSEILEIDKNLSMELCYCSIYKECWVIDRENKAKPIDACFIPNEQAFLQ